MGATTRHRWEWIRWTRWPLSGAVVALAALTVVVDVASAWADVPLGSLGRVPITPALPLGVVLALAVGVRRLGLDPANRRAWREFLLVGTVALVGAVVGYSVSIGGVSESVGLVVAALGEELVYRLAVIVVVGASTARLLGRPWRNAEDWGLAPGITALLAGGLVFTLLPGHVAQMDGALTALPFASLGVVLGYAVLRTGALLPAVVVHAFLNIVTIAVIVGEVSVGMRAGLAVSALVALVSGTVVAGQRLGILRRVPANPLAPGPAAA